MKLESNWILKPKKKFSHRKLQITSFAYSVLVLNRKCENGTEISDNQKKKQNNFIFL
jgi:hypothetical protein